MAKRSKKYFPKADFGDELQGSNPLEIIPKDNYQKYNWQQIHQQQIPQQNNPQQGAIENTSQNNMKPFMKGAAGFAKSAGQGLGDIVTGGISLANALVPDNKNKQLLRPDMQQMRTYNPYQYGTGSEAIYEDGGVVDGVGDWSTRQVEQPYHPMKKHGIQVSYDNTTTPYSGNQYPDPNAINYQAPNTDYSHTTPSGEDYVRYERTRGVRGEKYTYDPILPNSWDRARKNAFLQQQPEYMGEEHLPINLRNIQQYDEQQAYTPRPNDDPNFFNKMKVWDRDIKYPSQVPVEEDYMEYGGEIEEAKSGIHIKKKNRGKFNALKKRTGKTTEELTHSKNPLTRKRAIFAQNAKKWKKHEFGGLVEGQELDLSEEEIQSLISQGYKLDFE